MIEPGERAIYLNFVAGLLRPSVALFISAVTGNTAVILFHLLGLSSRVRILADKRQICLLTTP